MVGTLHCIDHCLHADRVESPNHNVFVCLCDHCCPKLVSLFLAWYLVSWPDVPTSTLPLQHKTRQIMEEAGLPTPRHYRISEVDSCPTFVT